MRELDVLEEDSVLGVLMYLFRYHMSDKAEIAQSESKIAAHLEDVGFTASSIYRALIWLANLAELDNNVPDEPQANSFRVYSDYENEVINHECRRFLLHLEQEHILDARTREMVIHQILLLESEQIDLPLIRWVTLFVLFNCPDRREALERMELLVFDGNIGGAQ